MGFGWVAGAATSLGATPSCAATCYRPGRASLVRGRVMSKQASAYDSDRRVRWCGHWGWRLGMGATIVVILGAVCASIAMHRMAAPAQEETPSAESKAYEKLPDVIRLRRLGLTVRGVGADVTEVFTGGSVTTNADLACIANWPHLRSVGIAGPKVTAAVAQNLQGKKELHRLRLEVMDLDATAISIVGSLTSLHSLTLGVKVTDQDLQFLSALTELRNLELTCSKVTDAGVAHLLKLKLLKDLDLTNSRITDKNVAELAKLDNLETLSLIETRITAGCLRDIPKFAKLKELFLPHAALPQADVEELRRTLPNLKVY